MLGTVWLVMAGQACFSEQMSWQGSVPLWLRNCDLYPRSYNAHYLAGNSLQNNKQWYFAMYHLKLASQLDPPQPDNVWKRIADSDWKIGLKDDAIKLYITFYAKNRGKIDEAARAKFTEMGYDKDKLEAALKASDKQYPTVDDPDMAPGTGVDPNAATGTDLAGADGKDGRDKDKDEGTKKRWTVPTHPLDPNAMTDTDLIDPDANAPDGKSP